MIFHKGIAFKILLLVLLCMEYNFVFISGEVRCIEREREALLKFKLGLVDYYGYLSMWWGMTAECCNWEGVVCSNTTGHVVALQLRGFYLAGEIKPALLELHHLNGLDLSGNYFVGSRIPEFIGSMKKLQHLNLRNSYFYGIIPPQLGNLTNLRTLDLSYNTLWSENVDWLSSLSQLSVLNLSYSSFNHTDWLNPIMKLHSLQELHLRFCSIADVVPSPDLFVNSSTASLSILDLAHTKLTSSAFDWLFNISRSLVKLDLSNNELAGRIPDGFGRLASLEYLDLTHNKLHGEIPKSLGNLSHLQILSLSENELGGSLEGLMGNVSCQQMVSLEYVVLSYNQFTGPVPDMRACSALRGVTFTQNKLMGSLPLSVGELSQLEILDVSFNSLEGKISEANLMKLHNLTVLDLSFNSLTIQIPPDWSPPFQLYAINFARCNMGQDFPKWIQTQSNLYLLDLSDAGISCQVPKWLWSFSPSLRYLNISSNHISGTIPNLSSTSLYRVFVSSNKFSGPIPIFSPNTSVIQLSQNMFSGPISSICTIPHINQIWLLDFSNNQLAGELPNCWEKITRLNYLNMANNSFSGEIPHSLGSLLDLRALHLRDNNLSGQLPPTLNNCQSLQLLDIGGNKLTGNISWIAANYTFMNYLMLGHNKFYGNIPPEICHLTHLRILDLSRNNFSGKIPNCFNNFTTMGGNDTAVPFVGGFNYITYYLHIPQPFAPQWNIESAFVQWKGQESEYTRTLEFLTLIDLSSNRLVGSIPRSFSSLKALYSLNLSRNSLTGNIISNIGQMKLLEALDISQNKLSGEIPVGMAQLNFLSVLDLANNNLTGPIPLSTQLQSFDASAYVGNNGLCGPPLPLCPINNPGQNINNRDGALSGLEEVCISVFLGFFVGFWGIVGSLVLKRSWRTAYFNLVEDVGDWLLTKFRRC